MRSSPSPFCAPLRPFACAKGWRASACSLDDGMAAVPGGWLLRMPRAVYAEARG